MTTNATMQRNMEFLHMNIVKIHAAARKIDIDLMMQIGLHGGALNDETRRLQIASTLLSVVTFTLAGVETFLRPMETEQ